MAVATMLNRPLAVTTVLKKSPVTGKDPFTIRQFVADESISQLFQASVDVVADKGVDFTFDQLLGTPVLVELAAPRNAVRFFHGICRRVSQSGSDNNFNHYRLEIVPQAWLLTKKTQSRIVQQMTVPDILKKVFTGLDPSPAFELSKFEPRDYCVQYHETDWAFASRLMEEEGIYYFFRHTDKGHQLVLANSADSHKDVPFAPRITFKTASQTAAQDEDFITEFAKTQEIVSGKVTLWDHQFELAHKHLEADQQVQESVQVGQATHKLKFGENGKLEIYNYPGEYAERFDGVGPGGVDRPDDLQKLFEDNKRTAGIRMQQEAIRAVEIRGTSTARQLIPGFKFTVATQANDPLSRGLKAEGTYVVVSVNHFATMPDGQRSGAGEAFRYTNTFTAIPIGLPFRPLRTTPKPRVPGTQTAVVCGPKGEEIFTDKYGRVKVQFHWDREGKYDADSSCWVRVATFWAGRKWGAVHIPRIGQEVVVDFLEGDPDRPIVVGSVCNSDLMPPYKLPENKTQSGVKSNSSPGGQGSNEIRFEDKKGHEDIYVHAQRTLNTVVEASESRVVGWSRTTSIHKGEKLTIDEVGRETVITKGDETLTLKDGTRNVMLSHGDEYLTVKDGLRNVEVLHGDDKLLVQDGKAVRSVPNGQDTVVAKQIYMFGTDCISLNVGNSSIEITPDQIRINSPTVVCVGGKGVKITGKVIDLN
jgi:type VI secretion system secreted protein VgrG